jgi:hypothetical protein
MAFMTYNLFFTAPFLYIEQIQLSNVPQANDFKRYVGFRIIMRGLNSNFADLTVQHVKLSATVRDAGTSSGVGYLLDAPIEKKYNASDNQMILRKRSTTKFVVDTMIDLQPSPNYKQIQELINHSYVNRSISNMFRRQYSQYYVELRFEGEAITTIGPLKHTHKITKRQQQFMKIKGKT